MALATIHPTAVVDSRAHLADGVLIGPYCVLDGEITLGSRCFLKSHVVITGPCEIGADNVFYPFASIGERTQDLKYDGEPTRLTVGNGNTFREHVTVHRSTAKDGCTRIGHHGHFLAYAHIAHDCVVGDHVVFSNNGTLAGHVVAEDHVVLGGLTAVHQFCRLGAHAITGGCSKIVQDVPPYMIADGNPAEIRGINKVGLERRGFDAPTLRALRDAYRMLYREGLNTRQALDKLTAEHPDNPAIRHLVTFVQVSSRGITR